MYSPLIGRTARVVLTKDEFIELVARTRSNWALAERLEELGVNQNLSHFVRANTALNQGGFEQVFAECDTDLLIAELRDIPGWFGSSSRLIRQLEIARDALAVLGNRKSTAEEKKQAEEAIGNAKYQWWTHRTKVLSAFWRGVRREPERFYDRSVEAFSGVEQSELLAHPASGLRPQSPLLAIFKYVRTKMLFFGNYFLYAIPLVELKGYCKRVFATDILMYNLTTISISLALLFLSFKIYSKLNIVSPLDAPFLPKTDTEAVS